MATGDFPCSSCGSYYCAGECIISILKSKPNKMMERKPSYEQVKDNVGIEPKDMTQHELELLLSEYMGDTTFAARFAECITMLRSKNADYSQGEQKGDRIAAFRRIARDIDIPMKKAWAVFCQKHWGAVMKFVKEGTVESEPIDGRINDIINYMVLLGAIIDDEQK